MVLCIENEYIQCTATEMIHVLIVVSRIRYRIAAVDVWKDHLRNYHRPDVTPIYSRAVKIVQK